LRAGAPLMLRFDSDLIEADCHAKYPLWDRVAPLPSVYLMDSVGASSIENFYVVGEAWSNVVSSFASVGAALLDIGCGCGRTARFLLQRPDLRYTGIDVFRASIEWSARYLTPLSNDRFEFVHLDVHNEHYNSRGTIAPDEVRIPVEDASIDVAFAASLFTHLLEPDAAHYLVDVARCLKDGGRLIASIHVEPAHGTVYSGTEDRIDMSPEYFRRLAREAQLELTDSLGSLCGQETFVFQRAPRPGELR
jgi:SAM-dependent methyltransferase